MYPPGLPMAGQEFFIYQRHYLSHDTGEELGGRKPMRAPITHFVPLRQVKKTNENTVTHFVPLRQGDERSGGGG